MDIQVTGPKIYFEIPIFGGINVTQTMVSQAIVTAILCWAFVYFGKNLKKRPDGKQVLVEKGVMMLRTMVVETMECCENTIIIIMMNPSKRFIKAPAKVIKNLFDKLLLQKAS